MKLTDHLRELRKRLLLAIGGILVAAIGGWFLVDPVLQWMQQPLYSITGTRPQLNFQTIGAAFDLRIRVSLWLGILISSPWWIFQIGAFIAPGLRRKEKIYIVVFGLVGIVLFSAGAVSGIWVVPKAVEIFNSFTPSGAAMLLLADSYITFFMQVVVAFGISCLIPEILVALNFMRILPARVMVKAWRWAIVLATVFSAFANPLPTAWPMLMQMAFLIALFYIAVGISALNDYFYRRGGWSIKNIGAKPKPGLWDEPDDDSDDEADDKADDKADDRTDESKDDSGA